MTQRFIIGIAGHPGTGKSTIGEHLRTRHDFSVYDGSDFIRQKADAEGVLLTKRQDYINYHEYRQWTDGLTWLTDLILSQPGDRIAQIGLRARPQFRKLLQMGGIVIALTCPPELCVDRADKSNPKNACNLEEYYRHIAADESRTEFGAHTDWCIRNADYVIENSGTIQETTEQIDKIIEQHTS